MGNHFASFGAMELFSPVHCICCGTSTEAQEINILSDLGISPVCDAQVRKFPSMLTPASTELGSADPSEGESFFRGDTIDLSDGDWQANSNGSPYIGDLVNGKPHGIGTFQDHDQIYVGNWQLGAASGAGSLMKADGSAYCGEFYMGKEHGSGSLTLGSGERYTGQFSGGARHGHGTCTFGGEHRGCTYKGQYQRGACSGNGVYQWQDGRKYEGEWTQGQMHGEGTFTFPDGRKYEGEYRDNKKNGSGCFEWPDGRTYRGQFRDGQQHGMGVWSEGQGKSVAAQWDKGTKMLDVALEEA